MNFEIMLYWRQTDRYIWTNWGFMPEHSLYRPTTMRTSLCDCTDNRIFQYRWKVTLNPLFLEHRWKEKPAQQITRVWPCNNHTIHSKSWWLEFYCTYFFFPLKICYLLIDTFKINNNNMFQDKPFLFYYDKYHTLKYHFL